MSDMTTIRAALYAAPQPAISEAVGFHERFQRAANVMCATYKRETGKQLLLSLAERLAYDALKAVEAMELTAAPQPTTSEAVSTDVEFWVEGY